MFDLLRGTMTKLAIRMSCDMQGTFYEKPWTNDIMNPITISAAGAGDADVLSRIIRQSFQDVASRFGLTPENCPKHPSNCTRAWIEADHARGVQYVILFREGEPVGCAGLERPQPDLCYLERLSVLPGMRRRGLGRTLALHTMDRARNMGARKISIGIIAGQTELIRWYAGLGFGAVATKRFAHLPFAVRFMEYIVDQTDLP
jgi:GNAT superfamily N-acetyltransferase